MAIEGGDTQGGAHADAATIQGELLRAEAETDGEGLAAEAFA